MRQVTLKKKTPRLQVIHPVGPGKDPHLYGTMTITPHEAVTGASKRINISWEFHNRLYKVIVPPGTKEGNMLRLKGLGKNLPDGEKGDLFLKVTIQGKNQ